MITTGITGSDWRASITPWGAIEPHDGSPSLGWYVAADDRWHLPEREPTLRQQRLDGTAVVETRLRVPNGDVVQRVFTVPDAGGITVVEVENESTLPVAIAFDHPDLLTERPVGEVPIEGIDLPPGSFVLPLGHRTTLRVGLAHGERRRGPLPPSIPSARQVASGWVATTGRASRFVLPAGAHGTVLAELVTAHRCEIALGDVPEADADPPGFAIALGELVRMGEPPQPWLPELVGAVEALGPTPGWLADAGLAAAERVVVAAGETRARRDLEAIVTRRVVTPRPLAPPAGPATIPWLESGFARGAELLADGIAPAWRGESFEAYGVPTLAGSSVSYAIRWHGARPAILWEQSGPAIELTAPVAAPGWATRDERGEALWPPPPETRPE